MDIISSQPTQDQPHAPAPHKNRDMNKIRKIVLFVLLVLLGAGAAYSIIVSPNTGWIPALAYVLFGSVLFAYRKNILDWKSKIETPVGAGKPETVNAEPHAQNEQQELRAASKTKLSMKHALTLIGIGLGALVVLFVIVSIFQPRMYLWFVASQGQADRQVTSTDVDVIRTLTLKQATEGVDPGTATQTIELNTDTKFVAPSSWAFVTRAKSEAQQLDEGVEVVVVDNKAYQRAADSADAYTAYEFGDGEYDSTAEAIEGSSFFQKGILEFMKTPRFVFNRDGQPWWMLHYRIPVDVDALEAAAPDWYSSDIYAFAKDPSLTDQQVEYTLELWINPFTRRIAHEQWMVKKVSNDDAEYTVQLDIFMDRTFSYPSDLAIETPATTTTAQ